MRNPPRKQHHARTSGLRFKNTTDSGQITCAGIAPALSVWPIFIATASRHIAQITVSAGGAAVKAVNVLRFALYPFGRVAVQRL
jgi:hypothetical protein